MKMLTLLFAISILVCIWQVSLRARETAILKCRKICETMDAQLLDETIALVSFTLRRDVSGRIRILRRYHFEISLDGLNRLGGSLLMLGNMVMHTEIQMPDGPLIVPELHSITRH